MYACVAATKEGARCRHMVAEQGRLCSFCQKKADKEGSVPKAPPPNVILVKININERWRAVLEAGRVPRKIVDWQALEEKHAAHAERLGRAPYRFRDVADSGVPVFGPDGICHVSLLKLWTELVEKGFCIQEMHLQSRRDGKMDTLVITLARQKPTQVSFFPEVALAVLPDLLNTSYGFVHIWANPSKEDKEKKKVVVHTVNISHREPEQRPLRQLHYNDGLWSVVELPSA